MLALDLTYTPFYIDFPGAASDYFGVRAKSSPKYQILKLYKLTHMAGICYSVALIYGKIMLLIKVLFINLTF